MNKQFLTMAAAAMMFAACSDDLTVDQTAPEIAKNPTEVTTGEVPVTFGAYVNRATTRAGMTSPMVVGDLDVDTDGDTNSDTQSGLSASGFGVFGYYTNSDLYVADAYQPNFMYNQRVYNASTTAGTRTWTYEPVKYWPNEFGTGAVSDEIDRVSFFAYAPYVSVTPSTGNVKNNSTATQIASTNAPQYYTEDNGDTTYGIIGLSRNTAMSDPYVKYVASLDPSKVVDLCYGVYGGDPLTREGLGNLTSGSNMLDLTKPSTDVKLKFDFKHALAQLNVQIDAAVDALVPGTKVGTANNGHVEADETDATATKTRIYVRSIEFEGLTDRGMLNLRDHAWYDMTTGNQGLDGTLALFDGRSDGREAVMAAVNEKNVYLNTDIVQASVSTEPGVTATAVNLFQPSAAAIAAGTDVTEPIYVIPTGQELRVTIVYDVETQDENLPGYLSGSTTHGSSVQNAITQTVSSGFKLNAGNTYILKLHLGMNSVKFDVNEVAAWVDNTASPAETSLPANISGNIADLKTDLATADASTLAAKRALFVGKFVNADGSISSAATATTVGKIAYLTNANDDIDASISDARILVLGNEDLTYEYNGSTSGYWAAASGYLSGSNLDQWSIDAANYTKFRNLDPSFAQQNTNQGRSGQLNGYAISNTFGATATNYAIYTAFNYDLTAIDGITAVGYGTDATSGAAGHWFLPTVEQMIKMGAAVYRYDGTNVSEAGYEKSGVMATLSGYYWSSSEYNATNAWFYLATNGYWNAGGKTTGPRKVRPVFAY